MSALGVGRGASHLAVLHPGQMGAGLAACARSAGCTVSWLTPGRSVATAGRAVAAGLSGAGDLVTLLQRADAVIAVCPPHAALDLATSVAQSGFGGLYLDANAIAPTTAARVAEVVAAGGAQYIDGGIVGPPPLHAGSTRLYVSGHAAHRVSAWFAGSALETIDLGADPCAASSLKMCYAAWTKGSSALLLAVAALAESSGVSAALRAEWSRSLPDLEARLARDCARNAPKAWRFAGEMEQIAATFSAHGLSGEFHRGAAATWAALSALRDAEPAPSAAAVVSALLERRES